MHADQLREALATALAEVLQEEDILRDLFAAAAAAGVIASCESHGGHSGQIAQFAYRVSDAMLAERRKPAASAKKR